MQPHYFLTICPGKHIDAKTGGFESVCAGGGVKLNVEIASDWITDSVIRMHPVAKWIGRMAGPEINAASERTTCQKGSIHQNLIHHDTVSGRKNLRIGQRFQGGS